MPETYSGLIHGDGGLVLTNNTTETFSGANDYAGGTTIDAGSTLDLVGSGSVGSGLLTLNGTFDVSGISSTTFTLGNLTGSGTLTIADKILVVDSNSPAAFAGMITGSGGSLVKSGSDTFTLSGINSYDGGTTIQQGTLALSGTGTLAPTGSVTVDAGAFFDIAGSTMDLTIGDFSGAGTTTLSTNPANSLTFGTANTEPYSGALFKALVLLSSKEAGRNSKQYSHTYTGGTTINVGTLNVAADGSLGGTSGTVTIDGGTLQAGGVINSPMARAYQSGASGGTIDTNGNAITINGTLSSAGGDLTKIGGGTLTLAGNGSGFTETLNINAGTFAIIDPGTIGAAASVVVGGTFDLTGLSGSLTIGNFSGTGTTSLGSSNLTFGTSVSETYSGLIQGAGSLVKQGSGTQTLAHANTYLSGTTINGGTLSIAADNQLGLG